VTSIAVMAAKVRVESGERLDAGLAAVLDVVPGGDDGGDHSGAEQGADRDGRPYRSR